MILCKEACGDVFCAGNIGDVLYGASLIPNLQQLFLANQSFVGTLPQGNLAMPALEVLDISNNHLEVSIPFFTYPSMQCNKLPFISVRPNLGDSHVL